MTTRHELTQVIRADHVAGAAQGCWTYDTYAAIPDDGNRYEIIDGVLYMSPAPNMSHQGASANLFGRLYIHVQLGGRGRVYAAPTDVELPSLRYRLVQPDIVVILSRNLSIIEHQKVVGTPDLVVEILSPGTAQYDRRRKQEAYAHAGVLEYWLTDPDAQTVEVLILIDGAYVSAGVFEGDARLPSRVLPEFDVAVREFFA